MNWIDELKEQQKNLPFNEPSVEEENFEDAMRAMLTEKMFSQPKSREAKLKENRESCLSLAEDVSDMAVIFYNKLKQKFTTTEITEMIKSVVEVIGGR